MSMTRTRLHKNEFNGERTNVSLYIFRSGTSTAATAFAIATSASSNPPDKGSDQDNRSGSCRDKNRRNESVMSTAIMTRVLKILRHWISKHPQDFQSDNRLKNLTIKFLDDIIHWPNLLPAEHKAAIQLLRLITKEQPENNKEELRTLLAPPTVRIRRINVKEVTDSTIGRCNSSTPLSMILVEKFYYSEKGCRTISGEN